MNKTNSDLTEITAELLDSGSSMSFTNLPLAKQHVFYIVAEIGETKDFIQMLQTLKTAGELDEVLVIINSFGGNLFTAMQIMHAINETSATVTCKIEGACMSAATLIFLAGHNYIINDHSIFMFHNYSSGMFGKGGEMFDQITHEREWSKHLFESVYSDFLSDGEIVGILEGKDIYLSSAEVVKRLQKRADLRQAMSEMAEMAEKPAPKKKSKKAQKE